MADENASLLTAKPPSSSFPTSYTDLSSSSNSDRSKHVRMRALKSMSQFDQWIDKATYPWKFIVKKTYTKECLAEFFGTFLLVAIGNGAVAQTVLSNPPDQFGTFRSINIGYGFALMIGVFVSIGVSGGHLNPAVTFAMALRGKMKWIMVVPFWIAQFAGAFISSPFVHGLYIDAINKAGGMTNGTAGVFASYPSTYLTLGNGFLDQMFGTFILLTGIFAITDSKNSEVMAGLKPFAIGLLLWAIGSSYGMNSGYAINPARDLGPRIYTAMVGWGPQVFVCDFCGVIRHWWWIPVIAPMLGGALAAFFYWFFIDAHHPKDDSPSAGSGNVNHHLSVEVKKS